MRLIRNYKGVDNRGAEGAKAPPQIFDKYKK